MYNTQTPTPNFEYIRSNMEDERKNVANLEAMAGAMSQFATAIVPFQKVVGDNSAIIKNSLQGDSGTAVAQNLNANNAALDRLHQATVDDLPNRIVNLAKNIATVDEYVQWISSQTATYITKFAGYAAADVAMVVAARKLTDPLMVGYHQLIQEINNRNRQIAWTGTR